MKHANAHKRTCAPPCAVCGGTSEGARTHMSLKLMCGVRCAGPLVACGAGDALSPTIRVPQIFSFWAGVVR